MDLDALISELSHVGVSSVVPPPCNLDEVLGEILREREHPFGAQEGKAVVEYVCSGSGMGRLDVTYNEKTGVHLDQEHLQLLNADLGSGKAVFTISVLYAAFDGGKPYKRVYSFIGNPALEFGGLQRLPAHENRRVNLFCAESGRELGPPDRTDYE